MDALLVMSQPPRHYPSRLLASNPSRPWLGQCVPSGCSVSAALLCAHEVKAGQLKNQWPSIMQCHVGLVTRQQNNPQMDILPNFPMALVQPARRILCIYTTARATFYMVPPRTLCRLWHPIGSAADSERSVGKYSEREHHLGPLVNSPILVHRAVRPCGQPPCLANPALLPAMAWQTGFLVIVHGLDGHV